MNKRESIKRSEMKAIWNSFEWLMKDKLVSLDNMTRAMTSEMKTMGVTNKMIDEYLPEQFKRVWNEVIEEQAERYGEKLKGA